MQLAIGPMGLLTIIFITLKLCHVIGWSWLWVFAPIWIPIGIAVVIFLIALLLAGVGAIVGASGE